MIFVGFLIHSFSTFAFQYLIHSDMQQFQDDIMKNRLLAIELNERLTKHVAGLEARIKELERKVEQLEKQRE